VDARDKRGQTRESCAMVCTLIPGLDSRPSSDHWPVHLCTSSDFTIGVELLRPLIEDLDGPS